MSPRFRASASTVAHRPPLPSSPRPPQVLLSRPRWCESWRGSTNSVGRCGAEGRFFKEKAPQKPFLEKVFLRPMGGVRTWSAHAGGGAPSICRWQRPFFTGAFFTGPIFLWAGRCLNIWGSFKLGFSGVLRQIPSESVGAIHESPASKLGFIELLRYGHPAKITYKPVGTGVLDCPRTNG